MQPALPSMKEMLDHIEQKMKKATYAQTVCVYDFINALMKE